MFELWERIAGSAKSWGRHALFFGVFLVACVSVGAYLLQGQRITQPEHHPADLLAGDEFQQLVGRLDAAFDADWKRVKLTPAEKAPDLAIARRMSLGLTGTIPSIEEIRAFEAQPEAGRLQWWLSHLLEDRRSADYLAERLARAYVGTDDGPFLVFRRRRFVSWLSDQLYENAPYDHLVRELIADEGLWTDSPAVNFVTATIVPDSQKGPDEVKLAARTARAFLGVRIDCVQCHDDNLGGPWKQQDFHQLAAFYSGAESSLLGIRDNDKQYEFKYLGEKKEEVVPPKVPFAGKIREQKGHLRQQLAEWVTHADNKAFSRAIVNRAWALMTGQPLVSPVDSVPLPPEFNPRLEDKEAAASEWAAPAPSGDAFDFEPVIALLADDFAQHGYDLRRLFRAIAATRAFQLDSVAEHPLTARHEEHWACFPLTRLRPEQVSGALLQAAAIHTIDANANFIVRLTRFGQQNDFIKRYGDLGDDEFSSHGGTIPQRLVMMNGEVVKDRTQPNFFQNAATSIAQLAPTDEKAIEVSFLATVTRRPTPEETAHFVARVRESRGERRAEVLEDLYWTLLNATEFSWNH